MRSNAKIQNRGRPSNQELISRRREEILAAAALVFAEQGYRQTDVQVIADRASVGKGTVYRYFPTKEDLFLAAVDAGINALAARVEEAVSSEPYPVRRTRVAVRAYLGYFDEHPEVMELLILERAEFKHRKQPTYFAYRTANAPRWRAMVEEAMRDGFFRRMPVDRVLDVVNDLLYGTIFTNHFAGRRRTLEEQADDILDILFHGFLPQGAASPDAEKNDL